MSIDDYIKHTPYDKIETGIAHFEHPESKKHVEIVSCMHVGTKEYYAAILSHLSGCDVVLYELITVKPSVVTANVAKKIASNYRTVAKALENVQRDFIRRIEERTLEEQPSIDRDFQLDLLKQMYDLCSISTQGEVIPYHNLPKNWLRADSSCLRS